MRPTRSRGWRSRASSGCVAIDQLPAENFNPRKDFAEEELAELAHSIRTKGLGAADHRAARPAQAGGYEIVAGERRWRAAQMAACTRYR